MEFAFSQLDWIMRQYRALIAASPISASLVAAGPQLDGMLGNIAVKTTEPAAAGQNFCYEAIGFKVHARSLLIHIPRGKSC